MRGLIPNVYEEVRDYQLGQLPPGTDAVFLKIGTASTGPVNEPYSVTEPDDVVKVFGAGPLVESAAYHLAVSGAPLLLIRTNASIPGAMGAVVAALAPGSGGSLTLAGEPLDAYSLAVRVERDGARGAAAFTYSLDGGDVFSGLVAVPINGNFPIPNTGVTLQFGAGEFKAGDVFTAEGRAPAASLADINESITAALNDPREWSIGHIIGAGSPTLFAALAVRRTEAFNDRHRFIDFVMEARDYLPSDNAGVSGSDSPARAAELRRAKWQTLLGQEYANSAALGVSPVAGQTELFSAVNGRIMRRSLAWAYVGRLAAIPVHVHPGDVSRGPLPGVVSITHDEDAHTGLDLLGFTTARTLVGKKGFYLTRGRVMAPAGSDFGTIEMSRVMNKAAKIARGAALDYLNRDVRVDAEGKIDLAEAKAIEAYITAQLIAGMVNAGNVSDAFAVVKRNGNILATRELDVNICIRPLGYLEHITLSLGFFNPALAVVGA